LTFFTIFAANLSHVGFINYDYNSILKKYNILDQQNNSIYTVCLCARNSLHIAQGRDPYGTEGKLLVLYKDRLKCGNI